MNDPTNVDDWERKDDRNVQVRDVKEVNSDGSNEENKLGSLGKNELQEVCRACHFPVSRNKPDLMKRIKECFESLYVVLDEVAEFETDNEDAEDQTLQGVWWRGVAIFKN